RFPIGGNGNSPYVAGEHEFVWLISPADSDRVAHRGCGARRIQGASDSPHIAPHDLAIAAIGAGRERVDGRLLSTRIIPSKRGAAVSSKRLERPAATSVGGKIRPPGEVTGGSKFSDDAYTGKLRR